MRASLGENRGRMGVETFPCQGYGKTVRWGYGQTQTRSSSGPRALSYYWPMRQIGFCGSLLALVVGVSSAQRPTEQQIRAVADSFYAAINAERWADAAKLLDMDRFRVVFKQAQDNYRFRPIFAPPVTAEDLMASDSTMPRAVAEWQAASLNKSRSQAGNFLSYRSEEHTSE